MENLNNLFEYYKNQQKCTKCNCHLSKHDSYISCQNHCIIIDLILNRFQVKYEDTVYAIDYCNNRIISIINNYINILCRYIPEDIIKDFVYPIVNINKIKTLELFQ